MKTFISNFKKGLNVSSQARKKYRSLQKHLNTQPVGFPATVSGIELRILQHFFTTEEAEVALLLSWHPMTFAEISASAMKKGIQEKKLRNLVDSMSLKGSVFARTSGQETRYSLHPLIIGMYEFQQPRLTPNLYLSLREYLNKRFAMEYYATQPRQMRVIPVNKSITPNLAVAAYDDIREIVDRTKDRISIGECICRTGKAMVGQPCKKTDRREVCMSFRDYHDIGKRTGWGRSISKSEALTILDENEKEGLVLMPSTMQEPQFVCSCCRCCCGIQELVGMFSRPVDFVESNYRAELKPETCLACGVCQKRCPTGAVLSDGKKAVGIDEGRCIGCGVCVSTCKSGSCKLVRKEKQFVPPKDHHALMETINNNKKSTLNKASMMMKAVTGFRV
jgi:H+/Na+-translocating ferredoxin:NAD+ oxidoreductase subunit B